MPDISVILPTARHDYSIIGQPELHFLKPTMDSLCEQSFKDFELVLVDALHDERDYDFSRLPFPVKHVPVHPNHRLWLGRKRWGVAGTLNTGLIHAEGELIVRVDDCSEFCPDFLKRFWEGYEAGVWPMAMHIRYLGGKPAHFNGEYRETGYEAKYSEMVSAEKRFDVLHRVYGEGGLVRDTRYELVRGAGGRLIAPVNWMYGYSSFTLRAALKVNGFDELFDGDKSLEDVDFGSRMVMAGYRDLFQLDVDHTVIEHEHEPIPEKVIERNLKNIKCNYAIYLLNRRKGRWRANSDRLTDDDLKFIVDESLKPPCSPRPDFYDDNCEGDLFKKWASNQPIFDLREERLSA